MRCARAARCLLVAGLTYFLCPVGAVVDFFAAAVVFFADGVAVFFADDFAPVLLEALVFVVGAGPAVADPVAFGVVSSLLFPSAGITATRAQRTAASTRAETGTEEEVKAEYIFPM
jgi:hypothetical protein